MSEPMMLCDLGLSVRAFTILRREGFETLNDVLDHLPYLAEQCKKTFIEICAVLKSRGLLPYVPGDYVEEVGDPLTFGEMYSMIGQLAILDVSTESHEWYKIVMITCISVGNNERRVVFHSGSGTLGNLLDIHFRGGKPPMYRIKSSAEPVFEQLTLF